MITEPQDAADYIEALLNDKAGELGLAFVGYADRLVPEYPAVVIVPGAKQKIIHATHTFNVGMEVNLTVYHARLDMSHRTRNKEDLILATNIENLLEQGEMNFEGQVIFAFVRDVAPGTITRPKGDMVVGTRMILDILSQKRFPYVP